MKKNKKIIKTIFCFLIIALIAIYFIGYIRINNKKQEGIIVLAYHHFLPKADKEKYYPDNYYVMPTETFEEQMKYLKDNNYVSITPEQIECYLKNECTIPKKAFIVTIDDGNISSYYEALPILEKYNFNSINFIITSRTGKKTQNLYTSDLTNFYFLGEDMIKDIKNNHTSMTIGSHSDSLHGYTESHDKLYTTKTYDELLQDSKIAKEKLYDTRYMAYPFGGCNESFVEAIKNSGYELAFTFGENRNLTQSDNKYLLPRYSIKSTLTLNDFKNKIEGKITLKEYTKKIIKKLLSVIH